jgi:hypothetical protein
MKNRIFITTITSVITTLVFGIVMYILKESVSYSDLTVFFIVYWITFFLTTRYFRKHN